MKFKATLIALAAVYSMPSQAEPSTVKGTVPSIYIAGAIAYSNGYHAGTTSSYFQGVTDATMSFLDCVPDDTSYGEVHTRVARKIVNSNEDLRGIDDVSIIAQIFVKKAYPCKK